MINKEKVMKVDIYNKDGKRLISTKSIFFPKDFFKIRGQELVVIKTKDLPELNKKEPIVAVFEYINGNRYRFETTVDISTDMQLNFHVGEGELLEERRNSFKLNVEFDGVCRFYERPDESETPVFFDEPLPLHFLNINLGGVLFSADFDFKPGDHVNLYFMNGDLDLIGEILRAQYNADKELVGYGCRFLNTSQSQEETIAKYILDCQIAERERRRAKMGM